MAVRATWRILLLVTATLVPAAMMTVAMMAASATSAFAGEESEESGGTSNPKIDAPAGQAALGKQKERKSIQKLRTQEQPQH